MDTYTVMGSTAGKAIVTGYLADVVKDAEGQSMNQIVAVYIGSVLLCTIHNGATTWTV